MKTMMKADALQSKHNKQCQPINTSPRNSKKCTKWCIDVVRYASPGRSWDDWAGTWRRKGAKRKIALTSVLAGRNLQQQSAEDDDDDVEREDICDTKRET